MSKPEELHPFPETADIETSSADYARRFRGDIGAWMLEVQENIVRRMLEADTGLKILDVGGGHGQIARPLMEEGFDVTVLASDLACTEQLQDLVDTNRITFDVGNVIDLPYENDSFDAVISLRLLPHCTQWQKLISELCRVSAGSVIVDYPTRHSVNALSGMMFGLKKKIEGNTRTYTLFSDREVRDAFESVDFHVESRRSQFFFPMVLHRMVKRRAFSTFIEGVARAFGLTCFLGSPVIIKAVPTGGQ